MHAHTPAPCSQIQASSRMHTQRRRDARTRSRARVTRAQRAEREENREETPAHARTHAGGPQHDLRPSCRCARHVCRSARLQCAVERCQDCHVGLSTGLRRRRRRWALDRSATTRLSPRHKHTRSACGPPNRCHACAMDVPSTHLQSHLPIYNPTYPSTIPLTHLQSHLPNYNPTYPTTIPLTHLQSHLPNCNRTCSWRGCSGPRLTLHWSTHRRHVLPPRCRRVPRGGSSGAPPGSHLARPVPLVAPPPHAGGLSPRCGAGPAAPGRCGGSSVGRWQIPLL